MADSKSEFEFGPHIEELKRVLGDTISEDELRTVLAEYMKFADSGVTISEAKKAIVKKYGGQLRDLSMGEDKTLTEVTPRDSSVNLKVKVISVNDKTVNVKGQDKPIRYGLIADSTLARPFTAWESFEFDKNDVVQIKSAYAKDFRGEIQINLGKNAEVEALSSEDPTYEELMKLEISQVPTRLPGTTYKIKELRDGTRNIITTGRIIELEQREITVQGEAKTIFTGMLADETGKIAFTAWNDLGLEVDDVVKIAGAYVKSWRGVPKLNFDANCQIEKMEENETIPDLDDLSQNSLMTIEELSEMKGAFGALVEGTVLEIKKGSGLIYRCPECNRMLQRNVCMVHGAQEGNPDLRVKAVIDDGTDGLVAILNCDLTTKVLGKDIVAYQELTQASPEGNDIVIAELNDKLLAHPVQLKGNVTTDNFGLTMICTNIELFDIPEKIGEEAEKLRDELGV
jgi:replication factor A1